jgi:peptidoglycan/xylan/chitin deacetylase (PgdA/CDA1 family)
MIGVTASNSQASVVCEFFELFKTPWEFCRPGVIYDVVICSESHLPDNSASLTIIYGSKGHPFDLKNGVEAGDRHRTTMLACGEDRIPIYGDCQTFTGPGIPVWLTENGEAVALEFARAAGTFVRVGFDLFAEVEELLRRGQPANHAQIPTLDLQIALLRDLIVSRSIPLHEIPPIPSGYRFMVCLTHDVDNFGIKNHRFDHTIVGFIYRALIGSLLGLCTGRKSVRQLVTNWKAVFSLPFVYLGMAKDFWKALDRYGKIENGLPSTFFVIPRKDDPGQGAGSRAHKWRAARYEVAEMGEQVQGLITAGCEIGLHGIDAWSDVAKGCAELEAIRKVTGASEIGVRMHWLYFDEDAPVRLEKAGFSYDSTVGYNETVGYRAGTTQAFQPLKADRLLELPMHVMDTALFYPAYLNLSPIQAKVILDQMIAKVIRFGGVLTVNWHDRSIAPDRLWDQPYIELLDELKRQGAWFATATQAVAWFRKRRSASIEQTDAAELEVGGNQCNDNLPGLRVQLHNPGALQPDRSQHGGPRRAVSELVSSRAQESGAAHPV